MKEIWIISIIPGTLKFVSSTQRKWDVITACGKTYTLCDLSDNHNLPKVQLLTSVSHEELLTLYTAFKAYSKMVIININTNNNSKVENHLLNAIASELREQNIDRVIKPYNNGTENM